MRKERDLGVAGRGTDLLWDSATNVYPRPTVEAVGYDGTGSLGRKTVCEAENALENGISWRAVGPVTNVERGVWTMGAERRGEIGEKESQCG